ncbi:MAG: hypothetical protein WKF43_15320 [Acidimicrobiales bacterium]
MVNLSGHSGRGLRVCGHQRSLEMIVLRKRAGAASEAGFLNTDRVDADPTDKG